MKTKTILLMLLGAMGLNTLSAQTEYDIEKITVINLGDGKYAYTLNFSPTGELSFHNYIEQEYQNGKFLSDVALERRVMFEIGGERQTRMRKQITSYIVL